MGHQLWISPLTGIRRKGTTFKELQRLFIEQITAKYIYEPLYSCTANHGVLEVRSDLDQRDFDVTGFVNEAQDVVGYVTREGLDNGNIQEHVRAIDLGLVVTDSTPVSRLIQLMADKKFVFVMHANKIDGIITLADINKPIVRIYLFGIVSLFEMHLNFWISQHHTNEKWKDLIKEDRVNLAQKTHDLRKGSNQGLSLLECLQFCDKRDILLSTKPFLNEFQFSKKQFDKLLSNIEKIRNELAHSQNSLISNLEWSDFISTISFLEKSLFDSEQKVEDIVKHMVEK